MKVIHHGMDYDREVIEALVEMRGKRKRVVCRVMADHTEYVTQRRAVDAGQYRWIDVECVVVPLGTPCVAGAQ